MERVERLRQGELLPGEARDEAPAARDAAGFEATQRPEHVAPGDGERLTRDEVPEDHPPTVEQLHGDGFGEFVGTEVGGSRRRDERPAASGERRLETPASRGDVVVGEPRDARPVGDGVAVATGEERAHRGEPVRGDESARDAVPERLGDLERHSPGPIDEVGEEERPLLAERLEDLLRRARARWERVLLAPGGRQEPREILAPGEGDRRRPGRGRAGPVRTAGWFGRGARGVPRRPRRGRTTRRAGAAGNR